MSHVGIFIKPYGEENFLESWCIHGEIIYYSKCGLEGIMRMQGVFYFLGTLSCSACGASYLCSILYTR